MHRDVKPENLLVHDDKLLIADFGSVRQVSETSGKAPASKHSILFRPREAFGEEPFFDFSSDTYQAGLIGYLLLGGRLDNDLESYLTSTEQRRLKQLRGNWAEECLFVDACVEHRICTGKLLNWDTVPSFVPKRFVTTLRRATTKNGSIYSSASEFLAELQKVRATLPDWMATSEGWQLTDSNGRDYLLTVHDEPIRMLKRKHGNAKWITDNRFVGSNPEEVLAELAQEIGLP